MSWDMALGGWNEWLIAAGRPESTINLRLYQLRRFAAAHPDPWAVTQANLVGWLGQPGWAAEYRRSHRSALRGFYGWACASGHADNNPAALLPPIKPGQYRPRPTPEEIVGAALDETVDTRVQLMVLLAASQGMRRGEIAQVHSRDLSRDLYGWSLRVHGKGDKERVIPLQEEVASRLQAIPGWAFPGQVGGHLSPRWVGTLIKRALSGGWTAHTLRHRFATVAYHGSRDLLAVQELLGHARPETTRRYVQMPNEALRAAISHAA